MVELLKTPNMRKSVLNRMDMYDVFSFKSNFANFDRIMTYDEDVIAIKKKLFKKEITYEESKILIIAHIKYFYDMNYEHRYNKMIARYIKKRNRFFVIKGE